MNHSIIKSISTLLLLILYFTNLDGQITGQLTYLKEEKQYLIAVVPSQTLTSPKNITNTGQITLKAPTGSFDITTIVSINGVWTKAATIRRPIESPDNDYHVFILGAHLSNPNIEAGVALPLFSFSNNEDCQSPIELVNNFSDEFWPPNSMDANIGNQLTILGFGFDNAYEKNDTFASKIECPENLSINLVIDTLRCAADSTTLSIEILDGDLPFVYTIKFENGEQLKDSLTQFQQPKIQQIPVGNHLIERFDKSTTFSQILIIKRPPPLTIQILKQENISCTNPTGTIHLQGKGGLKEDSFQYNWSNGTQGNKQDNLLAGNYTVTLTDINNCSTTQTLLIEELPKLSIDSIEIYSPSCADTKDGTIEMVHISNGQPPYQFGLNDKLLQNERYFKNLTGGDYRIIVTDAKNCVTSKRVTLDTPKAIEISAMPKDTYLLKGEQLHLQPTFNLNTPLYYNWHPSRFLSCVDCANPIAQPAHTITYTLTVSTLLGCETSIDHQIKVLDKTPIYIPNIFSPTSNGENTHLMVFTGATIQKILRFQIYNRWGQLVHQVKNRSIHQNLMWNGYYQGQLADSGIYIYVVEVLLTNNKTEIHRGDFFLKK